MIKKIKHKIYSWLGLIDWPVVKVYKGFGNTDKIHVMGHVFALSPKPRKNFTSNWFINFFSVIRLFMVKTIPDAKVAVLWEGDIYETTTETDGFFKLEINLKKECGYGWVPVSATYKYGPNNSITKGHGSIFIPAMTQVAFISDIDDTFLISHTATLRRRLYVLFTRNGRSRKAFDGVINHYTQLSISGTPDSGVTNPFFYVSSSEWNLYDFLDEFVRFNQLPKGVFLLGQMKKIKDFWKSGQNNHATKFMRIARILEAYREQKFILLGDDSQQDPIIYASIVEHFPDKILAVYLRRINKQNFEKVTGIVNAIQKKGVECCYFEHSSAAIIHSKKTGLILE